MDEHGFKAIKVIRWPDGGLIRSFVLVIRKKRGGKRDYILKYFGQGTNQARIRFEREIRFASQRDRFPNPFKAHLLPLTHFSFDPLYQIMPGYPGSPLGHFVDDLGIGWGKFSTVSFSELARFLVSTFDLNPKEFDLGFFGPRHVSTEVDKYQKDTPSIIAEPLWDRLRDFLAANEAAAYKHQKVSHRDLYPENFLFRANLSRRFKLIDWEYVSSVPVGFDSAFFYLLFWREKIWRDRIYSFSRRRFVNAGEPGASRRQRHFDISFRYCTALLSLRFLYQVSSFRREKHLTKDDRVETALAIKFWRKALGQAISGELVQPDDIRFMVEAATIREILDDYDIGDYRRHKSYLLSQGNTVLKVRTTTGSFIFRIYRCTRPLTQVRREVEIFWALSGQGIPTYRVIKNRSGKLLTKRLLFGRRRKIAVLGYLRGKSPTRHEINLPVVRKAGRMLRRIHDLDVTHGDFSKRNVLFNKGEISGVLDFEYSLPDSPAQNSKQKTNL